MASQHNGLSVKLHVLKLARTIGMGKKDHLKISEPDSTGQVNPAFSFENIVDEKKETKINGNMNSNSKFAVVSEECEEYENGGSETTVSANCDANKDTISNKETQENDKIYTISKTHSNFKPFDIELLFPNGKSEFENVSPEVGNGGRRSYRNMSCRSHLEMRSRLDSTLPARRASCSGSHRPSSHETRLDAQRDMSGPPPELRRSDYSVVSCGELTAGSLDVWLELPDQVKYDPALAPFRELYEKEHGKLQELVNARNGNASSKRLPYVKSAPHLNNNAPAPGQREGRGAILDAGKAAATAGGTAETSHHGSHSLHRQTKLQSALHYVKMAALLGCWVFFTVAFMLYNEKESVVRHSSVAAQETKTYYLNSTSPLKVLVRLEGPFWSEEAEKARNESDPSRRDVQRMRVWLERWSIDPEDILDVQKSDQNWSLVLLDEHLIDFSVGEVRSKLLALDPPRVDNGSQRYQHVLRIRTDSNQTTPFTLTYSLQPLSETTGLVFAALLLLGLYSLIIFEIMNRTLAAVLISTSALAVLAAVGERPSLPELVSWLDVETLLLLFSMMVLVAITAETGLFDYLAVYTFSVTKGRMWPLINLLCFFTAFLSTFLDNVTTVLLMTPVTIRLCEVMQLNPVPVLMAMVLYSNIGGTATPVGDPPNVIIASNADVINSGINFANFTLHMTLGILLVSVQTYFQLRFMYRDVNKLRLSVPKEIQELRQQITVWRRAAASLASYSRDEELVRLALEKKVAKLDIKLREKVKERKNMAVPAETYEGMLNELKEKYKIRDKALLIKSSVAIAFVVTVFFLHSIPELKRVSLGWTALLGAILLLILADREDIEHILNRVEWSTLLFFAALFVLMEALSKLGLISWIGGLTESLILQVDEGGRLAVSIVLMLWVSGIASAFVDNIPLTTMMVRVVTSLGNNPALGLPMAPLIWALSFGACLGGNGTLIGASANVVTAGVAEQHGYRFTFVEFFKVGFPLMLGHLVVATFYLLLCHCVFTWH